MLHGVEQCQTLISLGFLSAGIVTKGVVRTVVVEKGGVQTVIERPSRVVVVGRGARQGSLSMASALSFGTGAEEG